MCSPHAKNNYLDETDIHWRILKRTKLYIAAILVATLIKLYSGFFSPYK